MQFPCIAKNSLKHVEDVILVACIQCFHSNEAPPISKQCHKSKTPPTYMLILQQYLHYHISYYNVGDICFITKYRKVKIFTFDPSVLVDYQLLGCMTLCLKCICLNFHPGNVSVKNELLSNANEMFYYARLKKQNPCFKKDHILFEYVKNLLVLMSTCFNLGVFLLT